jgi:hypothetical protein
MEWLSRLFKLSDPPNCLGQAIAKLEGTKDDTFVEIAPLEELGLKEVPVDTARVIGGLVCKNGREILVHAVCKDPTDPDVYWHRRATGKDVEPTTLEEAFGPGLKEEPSLRLVGLVLKEPRG